MDYHQIIPKLFVGSYPRSTDDVEVLKGEAGITAVLNLQTDDDLRHLDVDWDALLAHYNRCSIHLRRVPVRDFDAIDLQDKLPSCVFTLNELMESGGTVYLHCSAGAGRSPTIAIAYLFWYCGWDLDTAASHVQQCRPCSPNLDAIGYVTRVSRCR